MHHPDDSRAHQFYAFTLQRLGRIEEAKLQMQKGIDQNHHDSIIIYNAARFYALIQDKKAAIENLKRAIAVRFENYEYLKHNPDLNCLQQEQEFIV